MRRLLTRRTLFALGVPSTAWTQQPGPEGLRRRDNPRLYVYLDLRTQLQGHGGGETWEVLRGKLTPRLELTVISVEDERPRTVLRLSPSGEEPAEVVAELATVSPLRPIAQPRPGESIVIDGIAASLQLEPFLLTLEEGRIWQPRQERLARPPRPR
jgi:hypothetical protein